MRRGAHERSPRLLLGREAALHGRERAGEVADLVAVAVIDRRRLAGPCSATSQRGAAQRGEAPHEPRGERDARHQRDRQRDERGGHERAPDDALDAAEALERPPQDEHAATPPALNGAATVRLPRALVAARARDDAVLPQRARHLREASSPRRRRVPASTRAGGVEHEHLRAGLAAQVRARARRAAASPRAAAPAAGATNAGPGGARRLLERRQRVLLELVVQREEHEQRGHDQRQRAHRDERRGEAAAQAEQLAHGACSR